MRVAIVGLGMAGLRAAVLLQRAGIRVSTFEARARVGGRTFTIDRGNGAIYEAGGEWADADHHRVLALCEELGEQPVRPDNDPELFVFQNERAFADALWLDAERDEEKLDAAARAILRDLPDPLTSARTPRSTNEIAALDRRTLADLIEETSESARGRWWLTSTYRADEGEDLDRVSLLGWLVGYRLYLERDGSELCAFRTPHGFGRLIEKMADELSEPPHLGWELDAIHREREGVRLSFTLASGAREELVFDRVVLALPSRLVRALKISPPLGAAQSGALGTIGTGRVVKLALEFDDAWWLREGWRGKMSTDLRIQQTWPVGLGEAPMLAVYACGSDAAWWCTRPDPVGEAVEMIATIFPKGKSHFTRGWAHTWATERYTEGGFSHLAPGFASAHLAGIRAVDDRIHFAGEHTAVWSGFVEGALESAERVAEEITSADRGGAR